MRKFTAAVLLCWFAGWPVAAQTVQERLPTCLACHGETGKSNTLDVPSLGGQQMFYVTVQLLMFRERMRVADPMNDMAKGLSDDDLQTFATPFPSCRRRSPLPVPSTRLASSELERWRCKIAACSATRQASPDKTMFLALQTSARITWSKRYGLTRIIPATATTRRWRM